MLNNFKLFFFGELKKLVNARAVSSILNNFRLITMESAFVVRTFFFVIFGMTITIATILDTKVALVSGSLLLLIFVLRFVLFKIFVKKDILPQIFIAPRGLITILLFFAIPVEMELANFNSGVLLFVIIISSIAMTLALVLSGTKITPYDDFASNYWQEVDKEIEKIETDEPEAKKEQESETV